MSPEPTGDTDLTITVWLSADAQPRRWQLTCDPPGGNHPNPAAACAALARAPQALEPIAADRICAQMAFGAQRAEVAGRWRGRLVHVAYGRTDSCEEERWQALADVFVTG